LLGAAHNRGVANENEHEVAEGRGYGGSVFLTSVTAQQVVALHAALLMMSGLQTGPWGTAEEETTIDVGFAALAGVGGAF
jgi:hypothetical protein